MVADFTRVELVLYLDRYAYPKHGMLWIAKVPVNGRRCIRSLRRGQKAAVPLISWAADGLRRLLHNLVRRGGARFVDHHWHGRRSVAVVFDVPPSVSRALDRLAELRFRYMGLDGEDRIEAWRAYDRFVRSLLDCQSQRDFEELLGLEVTAR